MWIFFILHLRKICNPSIFFLQNMWPPVFSKSPTPNSTSNVFIFLDIYAKYILYIFCDPMPDCLLIFLTHLKKYPHTQGRVNDTSLNLRDDSLTPDWECVDIFSFPTARNMRPPFLTHSKISIHHILVRFNEWSLWHCFSICHWNIRQSINV